jgi:hypothetical protein
MSLGIKIIDKVSGEILNEINPKLLVDDTLDIIKNKLFCYSEIDKYPNLVKVEIKDQDDKYVTVRDNNCLLFNYPNNLPDDINIYVTSLFTIIDGESYDNIVLESNVLYDLYITEGLSVLYDKLVVDFIDLTEEDLSNIVQIKLLTQYHQGNVRLRDEVKTNYENDMNEYFKLIQIKQEIVKKKTIQFEKYLGKYYKYAYDLQDYSDYYNIKECEGCTYGIPEFIYTNVSVTIRGNSYETGVSGKFLKLSQIFNILQLSDNIPFIAYNRSSRSDPMVKVYNKLIDTVSEKEIKNWILNEKKKLEQLSYKKLKGIMIKYKLSDKEYLTFNINENGLIYAKVGFEEDNQQTSIDTIVNTIKDGVDKIITILNGLQGTSSHLIESSNESQLFIDSVNTTLDTKYLIVRNKFASIFNKREFSNNLFELKDTKSSEILSVYYKKYGRREFEDVDSDRKGITVNIKDNPFEEDSSIITIYGGYNTNQLIVIVKQLVILSLLIEKDLDDILDEDEPRRMKLKEKSNIKFLRKQGAYVQSTKCQKDRQPIIDIDGTLKPLTYALDYDNKKYVCPNPEYAYPGFTPDNILCCFKNDQQRRPVFIRNTKSKNFDIIVQPSNFSVRVLDKKTNEFYDTFAIKMVSDIGDVGSLENESKYYYLDEKNELVQIIDEATINILDEADEGENSIWLDNVPLTRIITEPPKNRCNLQPKVNDKSTDINKPCEHHVKNKIFGYNLNSYPCCFDKKREIYNTRKRKEFDITKQHILKSDKILDYQRIGSLPPGIDKLFNEIIEKKESETYYRMGIMQSRWSFFNAILLAIKNQVDGTIINNSTEFKRYLANYLNLHPSEFDRLNSGNISLKYTSLENYINVLNNLNTNIIWNDVIDIIGRVIKCNILIFDIPYTVTESTNIFDYNNIKLICNINVQIDKDKPFIILIKKQKTFETLIKITHEDTQQPKIDFELNYSKDDTIKTNPINFLLDYYTSSCIKENVLPETFMFDELYTFKELVSLLKNTPYNIKAQFVNPFNKVDLVVLNNGVIIPIKETGIVDNISFIKFGEKVVNSSKILNIDQYKSNMIDINKLLDKSKQIKVLGATVLDEMYTSILTNFGQLIPVQKTEVDESDDIKILPFKYYWDVNDYLSGEKSDLNMQKRYNDNLALFKDIVFKIKKFLAQQLLENPSDKEFIIELNKRTDISNGKKIELMIVILNKHLANMQDLPDKNVLDFILRHVSLEIINDNRENLLLNNLITSDVFNPNEIIKRNEESIWLNIDDIKKWIKKHTMLF